MICQAGWTGIILLHDEAVSRWQGCPMYRPNILYKIHETTLALVLVRLLSHLHHKLLPAMSPFLGHFLIIYVEAPVQRYSKAHARVACTARTSCCSPTAATDGIILVFSTGIIKWYPIKCSMLRCRPKRLSIPWSSEVGGTPLQMTVGGPPGRWQREHVCFNSIIDPPTGLSL